MSSTDIEELCMADKLHNDEGKIELTADFLCGEIEKYGFINELHRTDIETAWSFNDLEFLRSQWEDTVLEQIRSLRGIAKEMLGTHPAKPQDGQQKTNRPLKKMEDYPDVFGMDICCQLTGYSKDTIYKLTAKNEIPCYRAGNNGRKLMFKRKDIIAWMLDRKQEMNKEFIERMDGQLVARMRNSKNLLL
jgi:excisionase family DNA binding protein